MNSVNDGNPMDIRLRPDIANMVDLVVSSAKEQDTPAASQRILAYGFELIAV